MILYQCANCGHEGEFIYRHGKETACVKCDSPLEIAIPDDWSPETTVFWKRPDGTYTLPANRDARMPPEYIRVEAQSTAEKRRIVKEIAREEYEKAERVNVGRQMLHERDEALRRSALRDRMQSMSAVQKDFARYAIDKNNNKPRRRYTGAFYLEALERDSQNMLPYRGPDGLQGKRR